MKVIIDTNRLQSEELWGFLKMSPSNRALLPDYVLMEAFKPGQPAGARDAFSILRQFPDQVLALKGTGAVSSLNPDAVVMADAMICPDETAAIPEFLRQLERAGAGGSMDAAIAERAGWANTQMDMMLAGYADMAPAMEEFLAPFTLQELRIIRQAKHEFTPEMSAKFFDLFVSMARTIFAARPEIPEPSLEMRQEHYVYRHCLCVAGYMMSKVRQGARNWKATVARNDAIDMMLATYATYFDGVMSADELTNESFVFAHDILGRTGGTVGASYVVDGFKEVIAFLEAQPGPWPLGGAREP